MMDVRQLQVLAEVARQGSINRAAVLLRRTPSAVSQQISALERSLGTPVIERSTRGVTLTEAGRLLAETADAVTAELARTERDLGRLAAGSAERLTVATFTSGGQRLLPAALRRLMAERPGINLTVLERDPEDSLPQVRSGAADLALVYHFDGPPPVRPGDRSGLLWTPLMDDPMFVVLPGAHPFAARDSIGIADLAGERWVLGCLELGDMLDHHTALAGFDPAIACRGTDYVFAQSLVRAGVGSSVVPQVALVADRGGLVAVPLEPPGPTRYVGVVTARRRRPDPLVAALVRALEETVAALPVAG